MAIVWRTFLVIVIFVVAIALLAMQRPPYEEADPIKASPFSKGDRIKLGVGG